MFILSLSHPLIHPRNALPVELCLKKTARERTFCVSAVATGLTLTMLEHRTSSHVPWRLSGAYIPRGLTSWSLILPKIHAELGYEKCAKV